MIGYQIFTCDRLNENILMQLDDEQALHGYSRIRWSRNTTPPDWYYEPSKTATMIGVDKTEEALVGAFERTKAWLNEWFEKAKKKGLNPVFVNEQKTKFVFNGLCVKIVKHIYMMVTPKLVNMKS